MKSFFTLLLGSLLCFFHSLNAQTAAIQSTNTPQEIFIGTQFATGNNVGWSFTVGTNPITLTVLGLYDSGDDGLSEAHEVGIWTTEGILLSSTIIPAGTAATLSAGYRYNPITPIVLGAGQTYVIGALYIYHSADPYIYNSTQTFASQITYGASQQNPSQGSGTTPPFGFPGGNPGAHNEGIFGPNFQFTFCVTDPIVTSNADAGPGSLRQAVIDACPGSIITFDMNQVISPISLSAGQIIIDKNLTIQGPGANILTIQNTAAANFTSRVFNINSGVTATISGLTISGGNPSGGASGGGIFNNTGGTVNLINSAILNNSTTGGGNGGGIFNNTGGTVNLTNSTISSNSTTGGSHGGGIFNNTGGTLIVINSTISNNLASGYGGGIFNSTGTVNLTNSTISNNLTSGYGGGIFNNTGTVNSRNSIIAGNTATVAPDFFGTSASLGNNLIGKTDGGSGWIAADFKGTTASPLNPLLGALANNGGPTMTHALLPGSPAINMGTNTGAPATDQRGIVRPQQSTTDIGAFESQGFTMTISGGNNQSTIISTAFANPLAVTVTSSFSEPVDGGIVIFTPPASGTSSTIAGNPATITNGSATTGVVTANAIVGGPYNVTASVSGINTGVDFSLTNLTAVVPKLTTSINGVVVNSNNDGVDDNGAFAVCYKTNNILFNSFTDQEGLVDPLLKVYQTYTTSNVTVPFCNNCWNTMASFTGHTGTAALINPSLAGVLTMKFRSWIDTNDDGVVDASEPASDWIVYIITVNRGIICPADITVNNTLNKCETKVNYPPVTSPPGSCGGAVTYSKPSGSYFPVGVTTVTVTTTGGAACSFKVTVKDVQKPVINCSSNIVVTPPNNGCSKVVTYSVSATDNCPGVVVTSVPASGSVFNAGTTTVNVTATDASGNISTSSFTVTVKDTKAPVITCPPAITVNAEQGICKAMVNPGTATATDNCSAVTITGTRSDGKPLNSYYPVGTTTITWKAKDASGNTATCTQQIIVKDNQPPLITNVSANPNVLWPADHSMKTINVNYNASDNCGPVDNCSPLSCQLTVTSNEPVSGTGNGDLSPDWEIISDKKVKLRAERKNNGTGRTYTIKITCKDGNGNTSVQTTTVTVPLTAPVAYRSSTSNVSPASGKEFTDKLTVQVMPNPSGYSFNLSVKGSTDQPVEIRVLDMSGRQVKQLRTSINAVIKFGEDMKQGTYIVEVRQGNEKETVKVIKL